jgi:hypothetical protein
MKMDDTDEEEFVAEPIAPLTRKRHSRKVT